MHGCHGVNGNSANPEWPALAGQSAVYIAEQLRLFRAGVRTNPVMKPGSAATVTKMEDIDRILPCTTPRRPRCGLEAGAIRPTGRRAIQLYRRGDGTRNIPACIACHGPVGGGNPAAGYPALRAQHAVYTVKQLNDTQVMLPGAAGQRMPSATVRIVLADSRGGPRPRTFAISAYYVQGMR